MKKFNKDKIDEWMLTHQRAIGWGCLIATGLVMIALVISQII